MNNIKIKKAIESDAPGIFILVKDFATSFKPEKQKFESSFVNLLLNKSAHLSIAEIEDKVVGYCLGFDHETFYANGRVSWVEEIMIDKKFRKLGIGKLLMDEFEKWSVTRESRLIALATRRAAPFYEALGYEDSAVYYRKLLEYNNKKE